MSTQTNTPRGVPFSITYPNNTPPRVYHYEARAEDQGISIYAIHSGSDWSRPYRTAWFFADHDAKRYLADLLDDGGRRTTHPDPQDRYDEARHIIALAHEYADQQGETR